MQETYEFLKIKTQVNYVSTINEGKPSCRPFGDPILFQDKIYVITNTHKNVSKQIKKDNHVCIVAYDGNEWIRINCKLIDDSNNIAVKEEVIKEFDWALDAGYTLDNPEFQVLYMSDVDATVYDEEGEAINTYKF